MGTDSRQLSVYQLGIETCYESADLVAKRIGLRILQSLGIGKMIAHLSNAKCLYPRRAKITRSLVRRSFEALREENRLELNQCRRVW